MSNNKNGKRNTVLKLLLIVAAFVAFFFMNGRYERVARGEESVNTTIPVSVKLMVSGNETEYFPAEGFRIEVRESDSSWQSVSDPQIINITKANDETSFSASFSDAGDRYYSISQIVPDIQNPNIEYDLHEYRVRISVSDNSSGSLEAGTFIYNGDSSEVLDSITFVNNLQLKPVSLAPELGISLQYDDGSPADINNYLSELAKIEVVISTDSIITGTIGADGNVSFNGESISYSYPGDYPATITARYLNGSESTRIRLPESVLIYVRVEDDKENYGKLIISSFFDSIHRRGELTDLAHLAFTVEDKPSISDASVLLYDNLYYTGIELRPVYAVTLSGNRLTEGTDYTIEYSNNILPGTASYTITGKGSYSGSKTGTFTISAISLTKAVVTLPQDKYTYTGSAIQPVPVVTVDGVTLTKEKDYTVGYGYCTDAGDAFITVYGTGGYTDAIMVQFTIEPYAITTKSGDSYATTIKFNKVEFNYSGNACEPVPSVKIGTTTLKKGTDYTVSYKNNTDAGAKGKTDTYPIATITGKGNYTGSRSFAFKINQVAITGAAITLDKGTSVNYTGSEISNSISSVKLSGKNLTEGTDYEIDGSSTLKAQTAGTYSIKINGKGNYTGTATARWTINRSNSSSSTTTTTTTTTSSSSSSSTTSGSSSSYSGRSSSSSTKATGSSGTSNSTKTTGNSSTTNESPSKRTTASEDTGSVSGNDSGAVSEDSVSGNIFPDDDIKTEGRSNTGTRKFSYDGSKNGTIENILTPAPGYENDSQVHAAVEDVNAVGEAILGGDLRDAVEDGSELEVWVDVKPAEDTVSDEEKSLVEKYIMSITDKVAGLCIGRYFDVSVFFRVDQGEWEEVKETNTPVTIDFSTPESMQDQSDRYYVLCIHDGQVEFMSDINNDPSMITVMTQHLQATYVLLYQDVDAGVAGEIFGPKEVSLYTEHDSFDFDAKPETAKKSRPKILAISWFMSSVLVIGGYGIWEALKDKEAIKAVLNSAAKAVPDKTA